MRPIDVLHAEPRPVAGLRAAQNVAVAVLAFALGVALLGRALPESSGLHTDAKLAAFAARKHAIDLVFLGSSRTYRGFSPALFDAELAARGHALTSFNFGIMGNRATEALELLRDLAELRPARLRWVLADVEPLDMLLDESQPRARRVIDWHDARTTLDVVRLIRAEDAPRATQLARLWNQWIPFVYHQLNVGAAQPWVNAQLGRGFALADQAEFLGPAGDGYRAADKDVLERAAANDAYARSVSHGFPAQVREQAARRAALALPGPALARERRVFFERLGALAEQMGAELVFVIQPTIHAQHDLVRAALQVPGLALLDYGDPARFPEFYTLESRNEIEHASRAGAEAFTRRLAADFAELLEAGGAAGSAGSTGR